MSKDRFHAVSIDDEIQRVVEAAALRNTDINFAHLINTLEGHCSGTVLVNEVLEKVTTLAKSKGVHVDVGPIA